MVDGVRGHYAASILAGWIIAATLLVLLLSPALLRPTEFVQDDSYFYLQIADHIVAGHGSTFHGITPTNGYHPLWMAGVVAADFLASRDRELTLHLVACIQTLLALGTAFLFYRLLRRMELDYWLPGVAVVLCYLLGTGLYGSEAHLNALLLVAGMLSLWHALASQRWRPWFMTGLLFGFATLARLDNLFVAAVLCTAGAFHYSSSPLLHAHRAWFLAPSCVPCHNRRQQSPAPATDRPDIAGRVRASAPAPSISHRSPAVCTQCSRYRPICSL
jgi:hypothetical protein